MTHVRRGGTGFQPGEGASWAGLNNCLLLLNRFLALRVLQAALCHKIAVALGFNLEKGRLDVSVHPFTGGGAPACTP